MVRHPVGHSVPVIPRGREFDAWPRMFFELLHKKKKDCTCTAQGGWRCVLVGQLAFAWELLVNASGAN